MSKSVSLMPWRFSFSLVLLVAACGYATRPALPDGDEWPLALEPIQEIQMDIDVGAEVASSVRRQIAARRFFVVTDDAPERLLVVVRSARIELAEFAEPALRAAQYQAVVELEGRLQGAIVRRFIVRGTDPFTAPAGRLEALDGARRASLARAADRAADALVNQLVGQRFRR